MNRSDEAFPPEPCEATLGRDLTIRVLNVSTSGCLVESRVRLAPGTTGRLRLLLDGMEFAEDVRVVRCVHIAGAGSLHYVGVEFLRPLAVDSERPLRAAVRRLQVDGRL